MARALLSCLSAFVSSVPRELLTCSSLSEAERDMQEAISSHMWPLTNEQQNITILTGRLPSQGGDAPSLASELAS